MRITFSIEDSSARHFGTLLLPPSLPPSIHPSVPPSLPPSLPLPFPSFALALSLSPTTLGSTILGVAACDMQAQRVATPQRP